MIAHASPVRSMMTGSWLCSIVLMGATVAPGAAASTKAHEGVHDRVEAGHWRAIIIRHSGKSASMVREVAEARYRLAEIEFKRFAQIQLTSRRMRRMKRTLDKKMKAMKHLEEAYGRIVATPFPRWSLCAQTRIGDLHSELADTIESASLPRLESEEMVDEYRAVLDDFIARFVDRAVEIWLLVHRRANELGITNPCVERARKSLARHQPGELMK